MTDRKKIPIRCRPGFWCLLILAALCTGYFAGPALIHRAHRLTTSNSERRLMKQRYHELVAKEWDRSLADADRAQASKSRWAIYYWFHARGWPIDEGWHEGPLQETARHWRELFQYWRL
jgi:hypothetical protein